MDKGIVDSDLGKWGWLWYTVQAVTSRVTYTKPSKIQRKLGMESILHEGIDVGEVGGNPASPLTIEWWLIGPAGAGREFEQAGVTACDGHERLGR